MKEGGSLDGLVLTLGEIGVNLILLSFWFYMATVELHTKNMTIT